MKFSILIPAYKKRYLKTCLDSVFNQTFDDYEVIILNDNSPEDVESIVFSYKDHRIKYFCNNCNVGSEKVVDNWNKCLLESSGDFVLCIGDDDYLAPNCLEVYDNLINKYPHSNVFHAWTCIINEDGEFIRMQEPRPEVESAFSMLYGRWFNKRMQFIGDWLFRSETLKSLGGFYMLPFAWGSDDITAIMCASNQPIINSQIPLFFYRDNQQTISNSGNNKGKALAKILQRQWYTKFLYGQDEKSLDQISSLYLKSCKENLQDYFCKEYINCIRCDMSESRSIHNFIYWFKKSSSLTIQRRLIVLLYFKVLLK